MLARVITVLCVPWGRVRFFFFYTHIIDTFYLLVVNYCCYPVCLKLQGCWASVYMCIPSPTCPPHLGGWWPAAAKKPKISSSSFSDTVLHFLERGRWAFLSGECTVPQLLPCSSQPSPWSP